MKEAEHPSPPDLITVRDADTLLSFAFVDLMRYHGPGSPGGVAHAFKVMQRAFGLLERGEPIPRRQVHVATAFAGPGARDGFEMVTRAVTDDRYRVDDGLARSERGPGRERFVFRVACGGRVVTLTLREGFVTDEFVALAGRERTAQEEAHLDMLKRAMAERVMSCAAAEVYDAHVEAIDEMPLQ